MRYLILLLLTCSGCMYSRVEVRGEVGVGGLVGELIDVRAKGELVLDSGSDPRGFL